VREWGRSGYGCSLGQSSELWSGVDRNGTRFELSRSCLLRSFSGSRSGRLRSEAPRSGGLHDDSGHRYCLSARYARRLPRLLGVSGARAKEVARERGRGPSSEAEGAQMVGWAPKLDGPHVTRRGQMACDGRWKTPGIRDAIGP